MIKQVVLLVWLSGCVYLQVAKIFDKFLLYIHEHDKTSGFIVGGNLFNNLPSALASTRL